MCESTAILGQVDLIQLGCTLNSTGCAIANPCNGNEFTGVQTADRRGVDFVPDEDRVLSVDGESFDRCEDVEAFPGDSVV